MVNKVTVRQLTESPDFYEFDYKHPQANLRVRRKVEANPYQRELLEKLLEYLLEQNLNEDETYTYIITNNIYADYADYLTEAIHTVYFCYMEKQSAYETEHQLNLLLEEKFSLSKYNARFCFLGKAGVGKSTIIKKLSVFADNEELPFPFTDLSRTTTYPADYCFVSERPSYKFFASFRPEVETELHIRECIERAIYKMIDWSEAKNLCSDSVKDDVFNVFISDPAQSFDIRYSVGKYIKTTSPAYNRPQSRDLVSFWSNLYAKFLDIIGLLKIRRDESTHEPVFYKLKYSDEIKNAAGDIYDTYKDALSLIQRQMIENRRKVMDSLKKNHAVQNLSYNAADDANPNQPSYVCCEITSLTDSAFSDFIQVFTTKHHSFFGRSLFNIVSHIRIELPLNPNLHLPEEQAIYALSPNEPPFYSVHKIESFVIQDTVGIAHSTENGSSFENSTSLRTDYLDAVVLVDDARLNGDFNITSILEHLTSRMSPSKILFAFSFFDDLIKSDFDDEDDLDEQRRDYLRNTQTNTIRNAVTDNKAAEVLIEKLNSDSTIFLKGLMKRDEAKSVQSLLNALIDTTYQYRFYKSFSKINHEKEFILYDYKKIPLFYGQAIDSFIKLQQGIYMENYPHFKTTEALTKRLSIGIKSFNGARLLTPVDDLYNEIITHLSEFIDRGELNVTADSTKEINLVTNELKAIITEKIRLLVNERFIGKNKLPVWNNIYYYSGIGCDLKRRKSILETEKNIAESIETYLQSTSSKHMVNAIEEAFKDSIKEIEETYHIL